MHATSSFIAASLLFCATPALPREPVVKEATPCELNEGSTCSLRCGTETHALDCNSDLVKIWKESRHVTSRRGFKTEDSCIPCPEVGGFDGSGCLVHLVPEGTNAFFWDNNFYHTPTHCPDCPLGGYDGANCFVEKPPPGTQLFLKNGAYFYKPGAGSPCPPGTPTSADGCRVGSWPSGAKPFIYEGAFYYVPLKGSKTCCSGVGRFDSKNCYLGRIPAGTKASISLNRHYVEPACLPSEPCSVWDPCPFVGTFDGRDCLVYEPPPGATAFVYDNNFYHTPFGCPSCCGAASFDTKNCFIGGVPSGTKPFVRENKLYVEARKCPKLPKPFIPNVFTPNGDGINDQWGMKGVKDLCSVRAYVFNRWGVVLHDVELQPRGADTISLWDGRTAAGTPVPEGGPYYYTVTIKNCSGRSGYSGFFYIYR